MDGAFLLQFLGSLVAVGLLVALAAWAGVARPAAPLTAETARALLVEEFPDRTPSAFWVAPDGGSAVARAGEEALLLVRLGDGYVARAAPWSVVERARAAGGSVLLRLDDPAAPRLRLSAEHWPPSLEPAG